MTSLELGVIGNSNVSALVNGRGEICWACMPRVDADAVFCSLLRERREESDFGFLAVDLAGVTRTEQEYLPHTAVLVTRLYDGNGGALEITDFAPRFRQFGRLFCPSQLVRMVRPLSGSPRIRVLVRPACDNGRERREMTWGSNHVRYLAADYTVRLTTNCSITAILEELAIRAARTLLARARPGRNAARVGGRRCAALSRADGGLLAGLGARPVDSVRVAGGDHPCRDHPQARRLRRHRRDHRRAHHLDSRGGRQRPQLGLPLLLAARRATSWSTRSTGSTRRARWSATSATSSTSRPAPTARCSPSTASAAGPRWTSAWSRRCPATAAWARCASATRPGARCRTTSTARRCSRRRTPSSTSGCRRSATRRCFASSNPWASARSRCTRSPTRACGSCAARRACTPSPASCAGRRATAWRRSPRGFGLPDRARYWQEHAERIHAVILRARLERAARQLQRDLRRRRARREPAAARGARFPPRRRSALRRHRQRHRARAQARRLRVPLHRA